MCDLVCVYYWVWTMWRGKHRPWKGPLLSPQWLHHFISEETQVHCKKPGSTLFHSQFLLPLRHFHLFLIVFLISLVLKKELDQEALTESRPLTVNTSPFRYKKWVVRPLLSPAKVSLNGEQGDSVPLRSFSSFHLDFLILLSLPTLRHKACYREALKFIFPCYSQCSSDSWAGFT